jgi:hypothetical protein
VPLAGATVLRRYKYPLVLLVLIALLVAVRAALPSIVKDYVNDKLAALEAYDGRVEDIDMAVWRGAYRIDGIDIVKENAEQRTPFFSAEAVEFSIEWASLFKGSLVSEGENEQETQLGTEENWGQRLKDLFPFRLNTVEVRNGTITFMAPGIQTKDALTVREINGAISNITNVVEANTASFADFRFQGQVLGTSPLRLQGSLDPNKQHPTFDVNFELSKVRLPDINPWLRQYIKADAEAGDFELYMEVAAADGRFKGYAKPLMHDVDMLSTREEEPNPFRRMWEGLVEIAANIFENDEEDQVAARIPLSGTLEDPDADLLATIVSVLRNAFVTAFARSLEGSISLRDVKEELGRYGETEQKDGKPRKDEKESDASKDDKDKAERDAGADDDASRRDPPRPPKSSTSG